MVQNISILEQIDSYPGAAKSNLETAKSTPGRVKSYYKFIIMCSMICLTQPQITKKLFELYKTLSASPKSLLEDADIFI